MNPLLADLLIDDRTQQMHAEARQHRRIAEARALHVNSWTRWSTAAGALSSTVTPRLRLRLTLSTFANRSGSCCTA
jgi:hypothetical protein